MIKAFQYRNLSKTSAGNSFFKILKSGDFQGDILVGLAIGSPIDSAIGTLTYFLLFPIDGFFLHMKSLIKYIQTCQKKITSNHFNGRWQKINLEVYQII